jgi:hypothetical protein
MAHDERAERRNEKSPEFDKAPATGREPNLSESEHRGDFAEGSAKTHAKPGVLMGDFAAGQEDPSRAGTVQPRGDFATGQEERPVDPTAKRGDYARGTDQAPRK